MKAKLFNFGAIAKAVCFKESMTNKEFAQCMRDLLVSEDGYVIPTGNRNQANQVIAEKLLNQISKHPYLWEWFFMVA